MSWSDAVKLAVLVVLACILGNAQSSGPRKLTLQEANAIMGAGVPEATRRLPGYELDNNAVNEPRQFYFAQVIRDNPHGSVVWGNLAVDVATGDLWDGVVCRSYASKSVRAVQREVRKAIGLTDAEYKKIKRPGPGCE
jgi:hypothetical protein